MNEGFKIAGLGLSQVIAAAGVVRGLVRASALLCAESALVFRKFQIVEKSLNAFGRDSCGGGRRAQERSCAHKGARVKAFLLVFTPL